MEASQLKISPDNLRFRPMSRSKRQLLRRENVKALIRSKPAGTVILLSEFSAVCASNDTNTYSMLQTMIRRGEISRIASEQRGQRYSYVVNEDSRVIKPKQTVVKTDSLVEKAKQFAWEQDSDSLRQFIKWMTEVTE